MTNSNERTGYHGAANRAAEDDGGAPRTPNEEAAEEAFSRRSPGNIITPLPPPPPSPSSPSSPSSHSNYSPNNNSPNTNNNNRTALLRARLARLRAEKESHKRLTAESNNRSTFLHRLDLVMAKSQQNEQNEQQHEQNVSPGAPIDGDLGTPNSVHVGDVTVPREQEGFYYPETIPDDSDNDDDSNSDDGDEEMATSSPCHSNLGSNTQASAESRQLFVGDVAVNMGDCSPGGTTLSAGDDMETIHFDEDDEEEACFSIYCIKTGTRRMHDGLVDVVGCGFGASGKGYDYDDERHEDDRHNRRPKSSHTSSWTHNPTMAMPLLVGLLSGIMFMMAFILLSGDEPTIMHHASSNGGKIRVPHVKTHDAAAHNGVDDFGMNVSDNATPPPATTTISQEEVEGSQILVEWDDDEGGHKAIITSNTGSELLQEVELPIKEEGGKKAESNNEESTPIMAASVNNNNILIEGEATDNAPHREQLLHDVLGNNAKVVQKNVVTQIDPSSSKSSKIGLSTTTLDETHLELGTFCNECPYKNLNYNCHYQVDFEMKHYNLTEDEAKQEHLKHCVDPILINWCSKCKWKNEWFDCKKRVEWEMEQYDISEREAMKSNIEHCRLPTTTVAVEEEEGGK